MESTLILCGDAHDLLVLVSVLGSGVSALLCIVCCLSTSHPCRMSIILGPRTESIWYIFMWPVGLAYQIDQPLFIAEAFYMPLLYDQLKLSAAT